MVTVVANLGLRLGEVAGPCVGRLALEAGIPHVEEAVGEANGVPITEPPETSAARRTLPLVAVIIDAPRLQSTPRSRARLRKDSSNNETSGSSVPDGRSIYHDRRRGVATETGGGAWSGSLLSGVPAGRVA